MRFRHDAPFAFIYKREVCPSGGSSWAKKPSHPRPD